MAANKTRDDFDAYRDYQLHIKVMLEANAEKERADRAAVRREAIAIITGNAGTATALEAEATRKRERIDEERRMVERLRGAINEMAGLTKHMGEQEGDRLFEVMELVQSVANQIEKLWKN